MGLTAGEGARPTPPPARPPASPELPPTPARARSHWLRRAAAAARTGRPGCQSPAGGGGGASCRGGFLFAWASAGNNERDSPGARDLLRPGTRRPGRQPRRRAPLTPPAGVSAKTQLRGGGAIPPPPPRAPAAVVPGGRRARAAIFRSLPAGAVTHGWRQPRLRDGGRAAPGRLTAPRRFVPPALRCRRAVPRGAGPPGGRCPVAAAGRPPRDRAPGTAPAAAGRPRRAAVA